MCVFSLTLYLSFFIYLVKNTVWILNCTVFHI
jgi:hypothetical protein